MLADKVSTKGGAYFRNADGGQELDVACCERRGIQAAKWQGKLRCWLHGSMIAGTSGVNFIGIEMPGGRSRCRVAPTHNSEARTE
eukprot:384409-Pyramimonas_sp.AAC.1